MSRLDATRCLPISSAAVYLTGLGLQMITEPELAVDDATWRDIARGITALLDSGSQVKD